MILYIIIFLCSVFISAVSQIILKASADRKYENRLQEYLNPRVIIAYGIFFLSSLMTILAYRGVPLSMGPVLEASGYVWVAVLGRLTLKEEINRRKLIGMIVIICGIVIFAI